MKSYNVLVLKQNSNKFVNQSHKSILLGIKYSYSMVMCIFYSEEYIFCINYQPSKNLHYMRSMSLYYRCHNQVGYKYYKLDQYNKYLMDIHNSIHRKFVYRYILQDYIAYHWEPNGNLVYIKCTLIRNKFNNLEH